MRNLFNNISEGIIPNVTRYVAIISVMIVLIIIINNQKKIRKQYFNSRSIMSLNK